MVKDIIRTTFSEVYETGTAQWSQWEVSLWKPSIGSQQPASFGITGAVTKRQKFSGAPMKDPNPDWCGAIHDHLLRQQAALRGRDAMLPRMLRWHLFSVRTGPMHYVANAQYWFKSAMRVRGQMPPSANVWEDGERNHPNPLQAFKDTVVFGAVEGDELPVVPELPRAPDKSDAWVFDGRIAEQRVIDWRKQCIALCDAEVSAWCEKRRARLMELFEADMVAWFGPDIVE